MQMLPEPEEREWLIQALGHLVTRRGTEPLLRMPLVEPDRKHFPDPWSFSYQGLDRVIRRLLQYAGLGHLDIAVQVFDDEGWVQSLGEEEDLEGMPAGIFFGIENGVCQFGFNADNPGDEEHMAGVMAHEVAHVFRAHHGLQIESREEEELLTDVTTVFLGFGILTANNSFRYRSSGEIHGNLTYQTWSVSRAGYLTPQGFAYLLALQLYARGDAAERRRVLGHLEGNQAEFTRAALADITNQGVELLPRLNLPKGPWEQGRPRLGDILQPLPPISSDYQEPALVGINEGDIVFRLRKSGPPPIILGGICLGLFVGGLLAILESESPPTMAGLLLAGAVIGGLIGSHRNTGPREMCSDIECGEGLPPGIEICPRCGGKIVGSIDKASQKLEAREAYEAAQEAVKSRSRERSEPRVARTEAGSSRTRKSAD